MKKTTGVYVYLAVGAAGILANFILHRYRMHLYDLNTDYEREPLQSIQAILLRGTEVFIVVGAVWLSCRRLFNKN